MAKNPRIDRNWREPIRRSEVATDYGISLARVQWDFFATLTFSGNVPKPKIAYGLAFRWLQELAKVGGVPYKRLLIALRGEEGEANGRLHRWTRFPALCAFALEVGLPISMLTF